jgi:hypothetical protein
MRLVAPLALCATMAVAAPASAAVQWTTGAGANGHWYEFAAVDVNFFAALAAAELATPIAGYDPHLATVTSAEENAFIFNNVTKSLAWFAGSDADVEGVWKWVAGPEAGTIFRSAGVTPPGAYANWHGGEPNNASGGEHALGGFYFGGLTWNDRCSCGTNGYVIEYSGASNAIPEPATWAMMILGFGLAGSSLRHRRAAAA